MPAERTRTNHSAMRRAPRTAARTPPFQFHVCHGADNELQQQFNHGGCMLFSAPCTIPARCTLAFLASMTLESLAGGCASISIHPAGHPFALRLDLHLAHIVHQLFAACCTVLRSSTFSLPTSSRKHLLTRILRRRCALLHLAPNAHRLIFRNMLNMPMFNLHLLCPMYSTSSRQAQESCRGPTSARRVQAVARVGHTKPHELRRLRPRPLSDLSIACVSLLIQACIQMITVLAHRLTMRVNPQHTEMPALTPAHNPKLIVYKHTIMTARTRTFSLAQLYDAHIRCRIFDFWGYGHSKRRGVRFMRLSRQIVHDEDHEHEM
jgi:hypothetical protein